MYYKLSLEKHAEKAHEHKIFLKTTCHGSEGEPGAG